MSGGSVEALEVEGDAGRVPQGVELTSRVLCDYSSGRPGPLFLIIGGMHGNEPSGVLAAQRLEATLRESPVPLNGRVLALAGNIGALKRGVRFRDRDLNRMWAARELSEVRAGRDDDSALENVERRELLAAIEEAIRTAPGRVIFLDLHSTSADGAPFSLIGDTLANRAIALRYPVPVILGLEERVEGALLEYFGERGHTAIGFEAGEHTRTTTVDCQEACIWVTLVAGGGVSPEALPRVRELYGLLRSSAAGLPGVVEIRHRHHVDAEDRFEMRPGFDNFHAVSQGERLATDREGDVLSPEDGLVLLPLYQGQGQDGFFVGREVRRFWLRFSHVLRRMHLEWLLPLMPGIQRHSEQQGSFLADPRIARLWTVEIFHLLGYRKCRPIAGMLQFSRRIERPPAGGHPA